MARHPGVDDALADRWVLSHFAFTLAGGTTPTSPFYQCIAASKTGDPVSGGLWLYALPMDPRGAGLPPVGTLNDYTKLGMWACGTTASTCRPTGLGAPTNVSQTTYTVPGSNNVRQPNTTNRLDNLGERVMQKVQYRRIGAAESLCVLHSTQGSGANATMRPQWAQIDVTAQTIAATPAQQQIYAPDTTLCRWMRRLADDGQGNMAVG